MRTLRPSLLLLLISLLLQPSSPATAQTNDTQSLVAGNTAFALDLYARLNTSDGNLCFSPYSISSCLAMAYAGARVNTASQMADVLHFSGSNDQLPAAFRELQNELNVVKNERKVELSVADGLWMQKSRSFLTNFSHIARNDYQADLNQADFRRSADTARLTINGWAGHRTKGRVNEIIPIGMLDRAAQIVLVNAIYFNAPWASPFETNRTTTNFFHVTKDRSVKAQLMHGTLRAGYFENDIFQAVQLPYADERFSIFIMLPKQGSLGQIENALRSQALAQCLSETKLGQVEIFLPKFKMEIGFELGRPLSKMGMADAFGKYADFSGISGTSQFHITTIMHKAYIDVNEGGTSAAAAASPGLSQTGLQPPAPVLRADHPFLFLIRDSRSGTILFLGRLLDPSPPDTAIPFERLKQ